MFFFTRRGESYILHSKLNSTGPWNTIQVPRLNNHNSLSLPGFLWALDTLNRMNYFLKGLGYKLQYSAVPEPTPGSSHHSTHSLYSLGRRLVFGYPSPPPIQKLLLASPVGCDLLQQLHLGRLLVSPPPPLLSKNGVGLVDLYHITLHLPQFYTAGQSEEVHPYFIPIPPTHQRLNLPTTHLPFHM